MDIANQAIRADNAGNHDEARRLYENAAEWLMKAMKCIHHLGILIWEGADASVDEKNENLKQSIRRKLSEYISRAEQIKNSQKAQQEAKTPVATTSGG